MAQKRFFIFLLCSFFSQSVYPLASCDLDDLANYYYDANQSGAIDTVDLSCIQYYIDNGSIDPSCASSGVVYYDVNYDCPELGGSNCITADDKNILNNYLSSDPVVKALALNSMKYLKYVQQRQMCGAPPALCDVDKIAKNLFNFYHTDALLNINDENCIHQYIIDPFHPENMYPQCATVHEMPFEYDLDRGCTVNSCVSGNDKIVFNKYYTGTITAMDIPAIQDIWNLHCTPNTAPVLSTPTNGSKYYWMANDNGGQFDMKSFDPDGDVITFSVTPLPTGAYYNPTGGVVLGSDVNKEANFLWFPIPVSMAGNYNLAVKANDGEDDSNIANIFATVAPYFEKMTDPQNGDADMTYVFESGAYAFDKKVDVGVLFEMDVELPWLPTPDMWSFSMTNNGSCPLPGGAGTPTWTEDVTNEAKARFAWTPDTYPPGGVQDICVSWRMEMGGGWIVNGLYHRKFRFRFNPIAGMTLDSTPSEINQTATVGSLKTIDFLANDGTSPYTYTDINITSMPAGAPPLGDSWKDADTWGFNAVAAQIGFTYTVTFQATDSETPIPNTAQKIISITVNPASGGPCGPGEYLVDSGPPELCCKIDEVQDPNSPGNCLASNSTIGIVDKDDFINDMDPNGFFSLCRMNDINRAVLLQEGVNANVNDMEFENTSNVYLL